MAAAPVSLAVIIPALDAARRLPGCVHALDETGRPGSGISPAVIVADGGSQDGTPEVARSLGATVVAAPRGRGSQLAAGAQAASNADWLLFLHADTLLSPGWSAAASAFMGAPGNARRAAAFRFELDDPAPAARRIEALVALRCRYLGLPYGDQGLLIARRFYEDLGGFAPLPLMEDVDLVRRIGRERIAILDAGALTSPLRYQADGYWLRPLRNLACLGLYFAGVPPRFIARVYG